MGDLGVEGTPAPRGLFRRHEVVLRTEIRVGLKTISTKTPRIADLTAYAQRWAPARQVPNCIPAKWTIHWIYSEH